MKWATHDGLLIAVGSAIFTSPDGVQWTKQTETSTKILRDVAWTTLSTGGVTYSLYCAVGDGGMILLSEDAINWTKQESGVTANLNGIARGLVTSRFVVVGDGGTILMSE